MKPARSATPSAARRAHLKFSTRSPAPIVLDFVRAHEMNGMLSEARARRFMAIIAVTAAVAFIGRAIGWW